MASRDHLRKALYIVLFALAIAMAYLAGMHEERGRQNRRHTKQEIPAAALRP